MPVMLAGLVPLMALPIFYYEHSLGKPSAIESLPRKVRYILAYILGPAVLICSWSHLISVIIQLWGEWALCFIFLTAWPISFFPCLLRLAAPLRALSPLRRALHSIAALGLLMDMVILMALFFPPSRDSLMMGGGGVMLSLGLYLFEAFLVDTGAALWGLLRRRTGGQESKAPADTGRGKSQEGRAMGEH